jgi:NADPH:quinone reductase-like Zn-dependent oxidoreductase
MVAVHVAVALGAPVIAPVLAEEEDYVRWLGVAKAPSRDGDLVAAVRELHPDGVDAILDLVNRTPGTLDAALKEGGRRAATTNAAGDGPGQTNVKVMLSSTGILDRIGRYLADGTIRLTSSRSYDFAQAPEAPAFLATTSNRGKLGSRVA